jgi:chitin disaccharide deacetylase
VSADGVRSTAPPTRAGRALRCAHVGALALALLASLVGRPAEAQRTPRPTAREVLRRLGLPDTARLVILHADDAAISPGTDRVTLAALRARQISSSSIIATTPYLDAFVAALPKDTTFDLGVHLTITSETDAMRWPPVAPRGRVGSLLDDAGLLRLGGTDGARPAEIERELEAQITRVRAAGIRLSHLDSHQGALLYHGAERFEALRRVAKRACLPIPIPETFFRKFPYLADALDDGQLPLADLMSIDPSVASADWEAYYIGLFEGMRPGVTLLLVHLDEDTPEERHLFRDHREYDAAWRARDAALVRSGALREMARWHGIQVITWAEFARAASICPAAR